MTTTGTATSPDSGHAVIGTALGALPAGNVLTANGLTAPRSRERPAVALAVMTRLVLASAAAQVGL